MRTYGSLARAGDQWVVRDLEPHVAIRLKALFPGVPKAAKQAAFPAAPTIEVDLAWFVDRYPLDASAEDLAALEAGRTAFAARAAEAERIHAPGYAPPLLAGLQPGQELRPHQTRAREILRLFGGLLVADETGKGKTYTAAGAMLLPGALPATVVCLPNLKRQWKQKIEQFTTLSVHLVEGGTPYALPASDVRIWSYMTLSGWSDVFKLLGTGLTVWDEIHELRGGEATDKGAASMRLAEASRYRMGTTATPIFNYGVEIWNIMRFLRPEVLGQRGDFMREWAPSGHVSDTVALGSYLRETSALVRERKDSPKPNVVVRVLEDCEATALASIEEVAQALARTAVTAGFEERGRATRELDLKVRQATGIDKAKAVARVVRAIVQAGTPLILYGWHRQVYEIWLDELSDLAPSMYTGSETPSKKAEQAGRFLNGETDILIMSLRSGAGVDGLQQRAGVVVFGELDWSPGQHEQCIGRADREGQPLWDLGEGVTALYLVTNDGSDPPMMEVLGLKASEAHDIVDPDLGVRVKHTDESKLQKLVQHYLDRGASA